MPLSQSQLHKLGERLKAGPSEADLRMLIDYRLSHGPASDAVAQMVRECTTLDPMQRATKSIRAILEKLQRQSTRLGSIQDIAGCRLTVVDVSQQTAVLEALAKRFPDAAIKDRRLNPSHGYRAVHLIVRHDGFRVEIQVRTLLQNTWAQTSEKAADCLGNEVKYGGGPEEVRLVLQAFSRCIAEEEALEFELAQLDRIQLDGADATLEDLRQTRMFCEEKLTATRSRLNDFMLGIQRAVQRMAR